VRMKSREELWRPGETPNLSDEAGLPLTAAVSLIQPKKIKKNNLETLAGRIQGIILHLRYRFAKLTIGVSEMRDG
jgi:hypothetical protein